MTVLSTILLVIVIISTVWFVINSPIYLYTYFRGFERADKLLEKIHCKWSARTIDNVGLIVLFVGFGAYVLRCIIIFTTQ